MARKVLVADDSVTIQKVVGLTFANEDIELSFVDNGEEAISIARKLRPDLIMADVLMPGRSGYEVCEFVKTDPELRHIPVLLLTGTFEPFDADRCAQVRADGTITKPFESQTLIRQVHELLDRPRSRPAAAQAAAPAPALEVEAEAAGSEDFMEPARGPESEQIPAPRAEEAVAFEASIGGSDDFDLGEDLSGDLTDDLTDAPASASGATEPADSPFEFNRDPESALNREELEAPQTSVEGAEDGWLADPEESPDAPPASALPQDEDVWDLSDFKAVDESQSRDDQPQASGEEPETLWNEAAAEAIDIVESTNLDIDGEAAAPQAPPAADESPGRQSPAAEAPDRFAEIAGENEFDEFELSPSDVTSQTQREPLELGEAASTPEPVAGTESPEAMDNPPAPGERHVPNGGEMLEELTLEEIAEEEEAPAPPAEPQAAPLSALSSEKSAAIVRDAVKDAVEKVTWEAFSDLSETVVRAVQEKVEKIAWEVIPQMAETIIQEEIRKLKEGDKESGE